ncbi:hypothetical protein [Sphingopyxis sp.]|jgi:hypothetical protein|uniref:hypothetical protein n=1 Tax=Sphingopyxis sp. TaxID=1908224 RepID=UPI0025EADA55|nr:hypothetical protein [Sphingopyxis sp.]MBK6411497.1 hypothetical protein [Sphingopyxis sp.]
MVQVAAALLFAFAAGLGITVILAMLKSNESAILSALLGEGAFAGDTAPQPGPATVIKLRPSTPLRHVARAIVARPQLSRAA